jgi:putative SOS response-associated peptidase YedK
LFFAGLYRDFEGEREFVILTRNASGEVAEVHDRMPVILRVDQIEAWLSGAMALGDIKDMEYKNAAVAPCEERDIGDGTDGDGQLSLFD